MTIVSLFRFLKARVLQTKKVGLLKENGNLERKTDLRLSVESGDFSLKLGF